MAQVYIVKSVLVTHEPTSPTWSLYRTGTGPGRAEGQGFKTVAEARRWAKKWGHEVVRLTVQGGGR